jgi:hypothetical protein
MAKGTVGILNVGAGDIKLVFDKNNPQECIRAARIVTDMLRRGYALMVEVDRGGKKIFQRAIEFREDTCEYIIADFDPVAAELADQQEASDEKTASSPEGQGAQAAAAGPKTKRPGRRRAIAATETRGIAISRSAGG